MASIYEPIHLGVYTYSRLNPLAYADPDGNLALHWHFIITYSSARDSGMGFWKSLGLAWRTMMADFGNTPLGAKSQGDTPQSTVQHAMAGTFPGGRLQTPEEAMTAAQDFVEHYQKSDKYLPNAIHATQDIETPDHGGKPWPPKDKDDSTDKGGMLGHFLKDVFPSKETRQKAYEATRRVLEAHKASPDKEKDPGKFDIEQPKYGHRPRTEAE
jgi:hypothetical protein